MIRLSIAAAALALLAATNPGAAQDYGYRYGYNSYSKPNYGYSRYGYKGYGYSRYGYKGYSYDKPSYSYEKPSYGYSRYGYQGYAHPSDFGFNSPYYGYRN
jgi:hypothetical protein